MLMTTLSDVFLSVRMAVIQKRRHDMTAQVCK